MMGKILCLLGFHINRDFAGISSHTHFSKCMRCGVCRLMQDTK